MVVSVTSMNQRIASLVVATLTLASAGCGEYVRQSRSPSQVVVTRLQAASGATPGQFAGTLQSDVITNVDRTVNGQQIQVPTVFNDVAVVEMSLILRDPGSPGAPSTPSAINQVTFNR